MGRGRSYEYFPKKVSVEDVNLYKMLRISSTYVGMEKVDTKIVAKAAYGPQGHGSGSKFEKKRATINTGKSNLNHFFQQEMNMMTGGSVTAKQLNQLNTIANKIDRKELIASNMKLKMKRNRKKT